MCDETNQDEEAEMRDQMALERKPGDKMITD